MNCLISSIENVFGCEDAAFNEPEEEIQSWKQAVLIYFSLRMSSYLAMKLTEMTDYL